MYIMLAKFNLHSKVQYVGQIAQSVATGYELDGPGIESRWGARFSTPVQTSPGAHPASFTMGIRSFRGGGKERPWSDADPSLPSGAMVKKE